MRQTTNHNSDIRNVVAEDLLSRVSMFIVIVCDGMTNAPTVRAVKQLEFSTRRMSFLAYVDNAIYPDVIVTCHKHSTRLQSNIPHYGFQMHILRFLMNTEYLYQYIESKYVGYVSAYFRATKSVQDRRPPCTRICMPDDSSKHRFPIPQKNSTCMQEHTYKQQLSMIEVNSRHKFGSWSEV